LAKKRGQKLLAAFFNSNNCFIVFLWKIQLWISLAPTVVPIHPKVDTLWEHLFQFDFTGALSLIRIFMMAGVSLFVELIFSQE
jgi:hypothetical protein